MQTHEIVNFLLKKGFQTTPDAIDYFLKISDVEFSLLVSKIIREKTRTGSGNFVITLKDIQDNTKEEKESLERDVDQFTILEGNEEVAERLEGVTGYHKLMTDRFARYKRIMYKRPDSVKVIKIQLLKTHTDSEEYKIAGLLSSKTKREKSYEITIEDESGTISLLAADAVNIHKVETFLVDQMVICDVVYNSNFGRYIVKNCYSLDIPTELFQPSDNKQVYGVFLSDIHVGSKTFLNEAFHRFLDWICGKSGDEDIVSKIRYVVVAGDVVDGIGIYPGQEDELTELDITKQYEQFADLISQIPSHITIFVSPGNHDATRNALPQPSIFKKYASSLYKMNNVVMLGDPCSLRVNGVNILVYHGHSLPDIVGSSPGITFDKPAEAMKILLKARHLAPTHGTNTVVALEEQDKLVIDEVPDIFHCGHVHTVQTLNYKGTLLINSGTWQSQTGYQRRLGIIPHPAIAVVADLSTLEVVAMKRFED